MKDLKRILIAATLLVTLVGGAGQASARRATSIMRRSPTANGRSSSVPKRSTSVKPAAVSSAVRCALV